MIDTDSILESTKKYIGLTETYEVFNPDIIMHINTVLSTLTQFGIKYYRIEDSSAKWSEYLGDNDVLLGLVQQYVYFKVRLAFDPPASGIVVEAINRSVSELEFRISIEADPAKAKEPTE